VERSKVIQFVDLRRQHEEIREELGAAVASVIESARFILGPEVEAFEREFADHCGVAHAVGTNSGTSALHLALLAAGVGPGDEVITVGLTFWATVAAILYTGATPVLVDVDPNTCTLDPRCLDRAITKNTRAILPVHLYGRCADMDAILAIGRERGVLVIEDAAQAVGSTYKHRPAGSLGDIACFSFYPAKNLGAIGEGGAIVTDSLAVAERVRTLRDHGSTQKYTHQLLGYNYRMEAIQGAALRVKLKRVAEWNKARTAMAARYRQAITGVELLAEAEDGAQNYHIFPVLSERRDALRSHLGDKGIETGIHYPVPAHRQPVFLDLGLSPVDLPVTETVCDRVLSLPMHPHLTASEVETVVLSIREFASQTV
jgi:dTDP-4-amino-4,6-dideoxygalactose transaminase